MNTRKSGHTLTKKLNRPGTIFHGAPPWKELGGTGRNWEELGGRKALFQTTPSEELKLQNSTQACTV